MQPPFTVEQFLDSFARYNEAVWPAQIVFYLVAALLVALSLLSTPASSRWISRLLALLWAWMGVVYHWGFFASINTAAYFFGGLFLLQATAFVVAASRERLSFHFQADRYGVTGAVMVAYALIFYPIIGTLAGHGYPNGPTFGLPCPTTIATFGFLLWVRGRVPWWLLVIPAAWSLLAFSAAFQLGIAEDYGLLVVGVVGTLAVLRKNRRWPKHGVRVFPATGDGTTARA
jgi:hypothetical protein